MSDSRFDPVPPADRTAEWFVPRFGSPGFRTAVGMLFLPYTGMVLSFAALGSLIAPRVQWGRVLAIVVIYFLGLGVAAHALDALGSRGAKPWGQALSRPKLWALSTCALVLAYTIAVYYILLDVPLLLPFAVAEGFFVFAYNLEWFGGRFHTDRWFAFSWGFLPVLAGYAMQTNRISLPAVLVAISMALFSVIEIKASRPYKELRRRGTAMTPSELRLVRRYERILQCVSLGVILLVAGFAVCRPFLR